MKRKAIKIGFAIFGVIIAGIATWCFFVIHEFKGALSEPVYSQGPNAVWAAHEWVDRAHSENQYRAFFDKMKRNRITDVYFHVGPWDPAEKGIPSHRYSHAGELLDQARKHYPELRAHAWIGQMTTHCGGPLDLSRPQTRTAIVCTVAVFLALGFDGIHYDFEPIPSGDADFIDLLKQTHALTRSKQDSPAKTQCN